MTYSKLLGCDPAAVTPAKAVAVWQKEISRLVREDGLGLSDAWSQLKSTEPDLFARFNQVPLKPSEAALDNGGTPQPPLLKTLLAGKPFIATALHLPVNVDNDVLLAAVQANGNQWVRVNPMKIWTALHVLTMQKNPGLSQIDSRAKMVDDYPELSKFSGQMQGQADGTRRQPWHQILIPTQLLKPGHQGYILKTTDSIATNGATDATLTETDTANQGLEPKATADASPSLVQQLAAVYELPASANEQDILKFATDLRDRQLQEAADELKIKEKIDVGLTRVSGQFPSLRGSGRMMTTWPQSGPNICPPCSILSDANQGGFAHSPLAGP